MTSEIHCDSLWHGADIVTMRDGNYHTLTDGAIAVRDGKIVWIGEHAALPHGLIADETVKFDGGIITPALLTATRTGVRRQPQRRVRTAAERRELRRHRRAGRRHHFHRESHPRGR